MALLETLKDAAELDDMESATLGLKLNKSTRRAANKALLQDIKEYQMDDNVMSSLKVDLLNEVWYLQ